MKSNEKCPWRGKIVKLANPIEVYDKTDSLYSYIFNLTVDGQPAGFIETSADKDEYPILTFSYAGSDMNESQITELKKDPNTKAVSEKVVLITPGYHGIKQDLADGSARIHTESDVIEISKNNNHPDKKKNLPINNDARKFRDTIDILVGDIGLDNDGVTDNLSFETGVGSAGGIAFVPDLNQITSSLWTGYSGCSPTSAANIMLWWSSRYPQLTNGLSNEQLLLGLRQAMGTNNSGQTNVNNISPGMKSFARNQRFFNADARYVNATWVDYKNSLSRGPNVVSFLNQTYYGTHSVTGVGWYEFFYNGSSLGHQYMTVHDNRAGTPAECYIAFGSNYQGLYIDEFSPMGFF